jgi:hypothetical protein
MPNDYDIGFAKPPSIPGFRKGGQAIRQEGLRERRISKQS